MILYDTPGAPSPRRARMFLAEKGLAVETRTIDLGAREQLNSDFLAINPRATVPVLITDDGVPLTENIGIAGFLEAYQSNPPLMGTTPAEKGLVLMWNAISENMGLFAISEAVRNQAPGLAGRAITGPVDFEQIPALAERGRKRVQIFFEIIEGQLDGRAFLATEHFNLADITAFVSIDFASRVDIPIPDGNTATRDWFARVSERPSAEA